MDRLRLRASCQQSEISLRDYMGRKRSNRGIDSSVEENMAATASNQDLKDSIDSLTKVVTEGFATIQSDMDKVLRNTQKIWQL